MRQMVRIVLIMACVMGIGRQAWADCNNPASDSERASCLAQDLRQADLTINTVYQQLMSAKTAPERVALRDAQRAWIKFRDTSCRLTSSTGPRDAWLNQLLTDYQKAVCVTRVTNQRVTELKNMLQPAASPGASPAPVPSPSAASPDDDLYDLVSTTERTTGKWYFEVRLNVGKIADQAEAALFIGILPRVAAGQTGRSSAGTLVNVRRKDRGESEHIVGIAVDLDAGELYFRANGAWHGSPGSSDGLALKLGTRYVGMLSSSVSLRRLIADRAVRANFGAEPFAYTIPDGYRAYDAQ